MLDVFEKLANAGLSVIPVRTDKRPTIPTWQPFQKAIPLKEEYTAWGNAEGVAIIAGTVSGNLVCIDIDVKHDAKKTIDKEYFETLRELGLGDALLKCVIEKTPSGGWHVVFRGPRSVPCQKMARDAGKQEAMIEIKGEGGYFVCAPTIGWDLKQGSFENIPTFDESTAGQFLSAAWALDRTDAPQAEPVERVRHEGKSPFDDYNDRATADDMLSDLLSHGWRKVSERGQNILLMRPGKEGRDYGATLHRGKRVFYVFTSSSEFAQGKGYGPVSVFTQVNHAGDFKAAARALVLKGYGDKREVKTISGNVPTAKHEPESNLLLNMSTLDAEVLGAYSKGADRGLATEWRGFDFRIAPNQLTVVTGYPSGGKSSFVQSIAVHMAKAYNWRVVIASIEDYPNHRLAGKLIRKYVRQPMYGPNGMSKERYEQAWEWVKKHFIFVNAAADNICLTRVIEETLVMHKISPVNALILDPWSELDEDRPQDMTETDFVKISLKKARKFARANDISTWIIAHPTKPRRTQEGKFPDVDLYDIAGSHHWRAKSDNGFIVRRDMQTNIATVHMQKIKFSDYGKIGSECDFKFDIPSECYTVTDSFMPQDHKKAAAGEEPVIW